LARLVLWDVDGTLIHTRGMGAAAFDRALEQVVGMAPASRLILSGKTDPQIALEYLEAMAIEDAHGQLPAVVAALEAHLASVASVLAENGAPHPGVPELLARLSGEEGVHQTLLTGNTMANALVKVSAFDLQDWLDVEIGAYGSDNADRTMLVPIAWDRARRLRGIDAGASDTWVVGDTANDLACARAAGARCLLVATGGSTFEVLQALEPDEVLPDLSRTDEVLKILLGP
jgi:phosphoglycolate phosphatase